jgi:hypothetical protein
MQCRGIMFVSPSKNFSASTQEPKTSKPLNTSVKAASERNFSSPINSNFFEDKISNQILKCDIHIFMKKQTDAHVIK